MGRAPTDPRGDPDSLGYPERGRLDADARLRVSAERAVADLELLGPGPASFVRDAYGLMSLERAELRCKSHIVGHLLREANGAILDFLVPRETGKGTNEEKGRRRVIAACEALGFASGEPIQQTWIELTTSSPNGLNRIAHRRGLAGPRPVDDDFKVLFERAVELFALLGAQIRRRYLKLHDVVDQILSADDGASAASQRLPRSPFVLSYLFQRLDNPDWISPLRRAGFFTLPPDHLETTAEDQHGFTPWPQAKYLARMAECKRPEVLQAVFELMMEAQQSADMWIHHELTIAALKLPGAMAAKWGTREASWMRQRDGVLDLLALDYGKLLSRLALCGEVDAAMDLMAALLEVLPDGAARDVKISGKDGAREPRLLHPTSRIERFCYDEIVSKNVPDLLDRAPQPVFDLLNDTLHRFLCLSTDDAEAVCPYDGAAIHRPAIEDHKQNMDVGFEDKLISVWRNAAERVAAQSEVALREVIGILDAKQWHLFRRLILHLLRVSPTATPGLAEEWILGRRLLFRPEVHHELFHLLRARFGEMSQHAKDAILDIVDKGESVDDVEEQWRDRRRRYGQYRMLLAVEGDLQGAWPKRLETLRSEFGEPHMPPDFLSWIGPMEWKGPKSPLTQEQIASMPVVDLVRRLLEWKPSEEWDAPTPDGLGATIGGIIESAPERWAVDLKHFEDEALDPTYHRHIVSAFWRLVQADKVIPFAEVLAFCRWVVRLPREIPGRVVDDTRRRLFVRDENRRPVRLEVARLVDRTLERTKKLDPALRDSIWGIIEPLTQDPDPTPDREQEALSGRSWDALTESLNTVRGVALHCTMRFLWWCRTGEPEGRKEGLARYPAVRAVLGEHLVGSGKTESQTDLAVIGQWLPYLISVDRDWVVTNLRRVFPDEAEQRSLCGAAWDSFVCYGKLMPSDYDVLKDVYLARARELRGVEFTPETPRGREVRFAEHMVWLYAWEKLTLEKDDLVSVFFKNAPVELAGKALAIARHVFDRESGTRDTVIERFRALWEWRMKQHGGLAAMPKPELAAFGWWFASGRFNAAWSFPILQEAIRLTNLDRSGHWVLKQLLAEFDPNPAGTLNCLEAMIQKPEDRFQLHPMPDSPPWKILEKGLAHPDPAIRAKAEDLTHVVGSQGHLGYRDLLVAQKAGKIRGKGAD